MLGMHHIIAGLEVDDVGRESGQRRLRRGCPRHQLRGVEKIFRAKYYKLRILKRSALPHLPFHQVNTGRAAGHIGAFGQVGRGGVELLQTELVGYPVLVEDIGYALYFTCRGCQEGCPAALLHQRPGLCDGHRHVAVNRQGRARRDMHRALAA